jgi:heat shock protein beta
MRNPKEVENTEYNEFYKKTFNEFLDPLAHAHFTTEVSRLNNLPFCYVHVH